MHFILADSDMILSDCCVTLSLICCLQISELYFWLVLVLVIYIMHDILLLFAWLCMCYSVSCDASIQCDKTGLFPMVL